MYYMWWISLYFRLPILWTSNWGSLRVCYININFLEIKYIHCIYTTQTSFATLIFSRLNPLDYSSMYVFFHFFFFFFIIYVLITGYCILYILYIYISLSYLYFSWYWTCLSIYDHVYIFADIGLVYLFTIMFIF
jgi:hypothetical protein